MVLIARLAQGSRPAFCSIPTPALLALNIRCHLCFSRAVLQPQMRSGSSRSQKVLPFDKKRSKPRSTYHPRPVFSTFVTDCSDSVEPKHFIRRLPKLHRASYPDLAVLLLSPPFASWADPQNPFLADCIRQLYPDESEEETILTTLVAVVDRVPRPPGAETSQYPAVKDGFDGLALYLNRLPNVRSELLASEPAPQETDEAANQPGVITFVVRTAEAGHAKPVTKSIQVPLANTIFSNGRLSTMFETSWNLTKGVPTPILAKSVSIKNITLNMHNGSSSSSSSIATPLIPLTPARKILSSMGNIVRQIEGPDKVDGGVPASSELEKAVLQYSRAITGKLERLTVWACIYPPQMETFQFPAAHSFSEVSKTLSRSFLSGARLHRVLSGGGGWGAKQGLLSLDPEQSYSESQSESHSQPSYDEGRFWNSGQSDLVKEGEQIQFFVMDHQYLENARKQDAVLSKQILTKVRQPDRPNTCILGVCESQGESAPDPKAAVTDTEPKPKVSALPNVFGALSEKGISIKYEAKGSENEMTLLGQTKLDVPFSGLIATSDGDRKDSSKQEGGPPVRYYRLYSEDTRFPFTAKEREEVQAFSPRRPGPIKDAIPEVKNAEVR